MVIARLRIADRRAGRDIAHAPGIEGRGFGQRQRAVHRLVRLHRDQLRDVAAAGTADDAEQGRIGVPLACMGLQPAHAQVGILHVGRVRCLGRARQVDRHQQQAAGGERMGHDRIVQPVLVVPGAAVQVQHRRERAGPFRLVDAREQRARRGLAELDVPAGNRMARGGIVGCSHLFLLASGACRQGGIVTQIAPGKAGLRFSGPASVTLRSRRALPAGRRFPGRYPVRRHASAGSRRLRRR